MRRFSIGIDTGGTYTDAAIIDIASHAIKAKAKALTTKGDLTIGVVEALDTILSGITRSDIALVSLSTTLATNAIVEGHGSPIAVIFIGFDEAMIERSGIRAALPGVKTLLCAGGHDHAGEAKAPLDEAAIESFAATLGASVEAFAVAAHYSVRNPVHEFRARDIIERVTARSVTLSCELAHDLDAPRRALTAALNARIIAPIGRLISAVGAAMERLGLAVPLMIVKGDGAVATAAAVARRPIETILSGPAASVIGAKFLSGQQDFIMADIGGTTTDIAIVENGWPKLNRRGAMIGTRRTMVRAIDIDTCALGSDTEVDLAVDGTIRLGSRKLVPLSLVATRHPAILDVLEGMLADSGQVAYPGQFALRPFGADGALADEVTLPARESGLLRRIADQPVPLRDLIFSPADWRALNRLVGLGRLHLAGFTPSDAAHLLHLQAQWSRPAAKLGAALLLRWRRMQSALDEAACSSLARAVVDAVATKTSRIILHKLAQTPLDSDDPLVAAVAEGRGRLGRLAVELRPLLPIIAVGGPAPVVYPEVGRRLGCTTTLLDHGDVANAVGAGIGMVRSRVMIEITAPEPGLFRIHDAGTPTTVASPAEALQRAERTAREQARAEALALGASDVTIDVHIDRVDLPGMKDDLGLIAATVIAEGWGIPDARRSEPPSKPLGQSLAAR
jgi:N-methylhydantoinase A/oxoprolinase/acetone carboxylase beta subunit